MKKHDLFIIVAAVFIIALSFMLIKGKNGATLTVKENNKTVYVGSIYKDKNIKLQNNTLIIKDGYVYMKSANCKNNICVHTGKIHKKGESIICLPNKVIAQIE